MRDYLTSICSLWRDLERPGLAVLDLSCGNARSTRELVTLKLSVTATNYVSAPPLEFPAAAKYVGGVDLNRPWSFRDGSFDGIHLQEVMEHLENPAHVVREAAWVLRPGGYLVLSTPNVLNACSRARFFLTGFAEGRKRPVSYAKKPGDAANIYITNLFQLHYLLTQYGFRLERLALGPYNLRSLVLAILGYPIFYLGALVATRAPRRKDLLRKRDRERSTPEELAELERRQREVQRELRKPILSKEVLLARSLMLRARKAPEQAMPRP